MSTNVAIGKVLELPKRRGEYGKGSCYQRDDNGRWEISFYDNEGRRRRKSFSTEAKAKRALNRFLVLKETGKLDSPEGRAKTEHLAEAYLRYLKNSKPKSYAWADRTWRIHLEPFFGGRLASRLGTAEIDKYVEERKADLPKGDEKRERERNGTINRELAILKAAYNHGASVNDPPIVSRVPRFPAKLRESDPRCGWLTDAQYDLLQEKCKHQWLRGLLSVAFAFGLRKAELLRLRVADVNLKDRTIKLLPGTTKTDKGRTIRMTEEVFERLKPCVEDKEPNDTVFTWEDGSPVRDFRVAWTKMCDAASVSILLHDFRRTAIRNMIRAGVSKMTAKRISGHVTDSVFDRYDIGDETDLADAAEKIQARSENGRKLATGEAQPNEVSTSY
jgi:integrase